MMIMPLLGEACCGAARRHARYGVVSTACGGYDGSVALVRIAAAGLTSPSALILKSIPERFWDADIDLLKAKIDEGRKSCHYNLCSTQRRICVFRASFVGGGITIPVIAGIMPTTLILLAPKRMAEARGAQVLHGWLMPMRGLKEIRTLNTLPHLWRLTNAGKLIDEGFENFHFLHAQSS